MKIVGVLDLRPYLSARVEDFIKDFVHTTFDGTWYCRIDVWQAHDVETWNAKRERVTSFDPIEFEVDTFVSAFNHTHRALLFEASKALADSHEAFSLGFAYDAYQRWTRSMAATNFAQHLEHEWMYRELFASLLGTRQVGPFQRFSKIWMRSYPQPNSILDIEVPRAMRDANVWEMPIHKYAGMVRGLLPLDLQYGRDYTVGEYRVLLRPEGDFPKIPGWVCDELHGAFAQAAYPGSRKPRW